ncbi:MAG: DUF2723 domain-containing protein [bacterium]|nr:DUF2723 domain-containing protein [bacterium]
MSKKEYMWGFIISTLAVFGIYLYTVQPSLSFWDCGEFIACGYSLGVPHPPGSPLYTLLNKILCFIPFGKEIAFRVNMGSVISGAITAGLLWVIAAKILVKIKAPQTKMEHFIISLSSGVGAMIGSFAYTCWWGAVEAEVYRLASLMVILCVFWILRWQDELHTSYNKRYLFLITYMFAISIGIQLMPILTAPAIFLFILLNKRDWDSLRFIAITLPFLAVFMGMSLIMVGIMGIAVIIFLIVTYRKEMFDGKFIGLVVIGFLLGIGSYSYLMIRSHHNPYINEAAPTNIPKLWDVFSRTQYGPAKLGVSTILKRETETPENKYNMVQAFVYQIKFFTDYLTWQWVPYPRQSRWEGEIASNFTKLSSLFFNIIFIGIGLFGIWTHYKKEKRTFWLMFTLLITLTFVLTFYMNFKFSPSDTNPLHRPVEVRERHYFYDSAFTLFGWYIGIGVWGLLMLLKNKWYQRIMSPILGLLVLVPIFGNFHSHINRRGNWIPDDYAYNMLSSCDDGAVIFTNGDNDTFPLWFAQLVKNVKPKLMVANLSLLNTDWYIKQLKSWGAPISFTDYEAENLIPFPVIKNGEPVKDKTLFVKDLAVRDMLATNSGFKFEPKIFMPIKRAALPKKYRDKIPADMELIRPDYYVRRIPREYWVRLPEEYFLPAEDFANIVMKSYKPKIPIFFAVTVSMDNMEALTPYVQMEAMAYRVVGPGAQRFNIQVSDSLLNKVYKYRSLFDPKVYKSENDKRLLTNYAASYFALGLAYREKGDLDKAIKALEDGKKFQSEDVLPFNYHLAALYQLTGRQTEAMENINELAKVAKDPMEWYTIGEAYLNSKNVDKAVEAFNKAIEMSPEDPAAGYAGLIRVYQSTNKIFEMNKILDQCMKNQMLAGKILSLFRMGQQTELAKILLEKWVVYHPYDSVAVQLIKELNKEMKQPMPLPLVGS